MILIAGPCSLESLELSRTVAHELARVRERYPDLTVIFKGSFDKANRTSLDSPRGPGIHEGLAILAAIKKEFSFPVLTDIHLPEQTAAVGEVCDILQIPAFLCRQTDLLVAAARTGRIVNVKKGQFLSPFEMEFIVRKLEASMGTPTDATAAGQNRSPLQSRIWLTDRGTTFGYQNLVMDMRAYPIMATHGYPTICDATHAVQLPGAAGGKSGGQREFVHVLARSAIAAGASGLFIETHPDPANAISDAGSQIPLDQLDALVKSCLRIREAVDATA